MASGDPVETAFGAGKWLDALRLLRERQATATLSVDELDGIATAAYLTGHDEEAFEWWSQAHSSCLDSSEPERAARFGNLLVRAFAFKGDLGRAAGWLGRVRQLVDETNIDSAENGYLEFGTGLCRIFVDGDIPGARACFVRADKIADRFGDPQLRALAKMGEGRCLIYMGDMDEGLAKLDEVMVAVEVGDVGIISTGDAYCTVIDACAELFDTQRCERWTASFVAWCDARPDLVLYRGNCLLHQAEVLQLHGKWTDAVAAAHDACRRLSEPVNMMAIGGAHYTEGELHRLLGDDTAAEQAYERANEVGCEPQPGMSLLRLAQGRTDVAAAAIRRVLAQADGPIARARVLRPFIEIVLATGDVDDARPAADELAEVAAQLRSPLLRAQAEQSKGAVALAAGNTDTALVELRRALTSWTKLDAPYEAARTRLLLAEACDAVGDHDGAELERRAARTGFELVGSTADLRRLDGAPVEAPGGLSGREIEVLVLVAKGHTNRAIAEELWISEKTVASHLSHVFTKLGVTSRAAATAFAYENGLV